MRFLPEESRSKKEIQTYVRNAEWPASTLSEQEKVKAWWWQSIKNLHRHDTKMTDNFEKHYKEWNESSPESIEKK